MEASGWYHWDVGIRDQEITVFSSTFWLFSWIISALLQTDHFSRQVFWDFWWSSG